MRRNGTSTNEKYEVKNPQNAYYGDYYSSYLFQFGSGPDITILAFSDINSGSYTNFGNSFKLPEGYSYGSQSARNYLSGNYNKWLTTEIEVFQLE